MVSMVAMVTAKHYFCKDDFIRSYIKCSYMYSTCISIEMRFYLESLSLVLTCFDSTVRDVALYIAVIEVSLFLQYSQRHGAIYNCHRSITLLRPNKNIGVVFVTLKYKLG